ncbi:hypothetical protein [Halomonas sp. M4R1S46]|uniref:hypothetical protein n=1 Tax=Halomonas sp. M4R1S46 TaxID=2982692 RepID=UPI0021E3BBCF|nr:hypothetical protein [Halomonas sp. M4R1S46]UYG06240.1 hypothetical protein OCT48_11395 [Halomonas sp. M4R1S46]
MNEVLNIDWQPLGLLIKPSLSHPKWLRHYTGASSIVEGPRAGLFWCYITGRDDKNRSLIGRILVDLEGKASVIDIAHRPCLSHGSLGSFDEDGVSYPCVVSDGEVLHLFYTGWVATCSTGFQNHLGRAISHDGGQNFIRISRAPVMHRTDDEPFSIGSTFVTLEGRKWRMWYTSFIEWYRKTDSVSAGHRYLIRYAESEDGERWHRDYVDRIGFGPEEHSVCHPSVLKLEDTFHMWFCARGEYYRIFHAVSRDGLTWHRLPYRLSRDVLGDWDHDSQCYPSAFEHKGFVYVVYSGNEYGKGGLGMVMTSSENLKSAANRFWEKGHAVAY